tara:strand:- start:2853 stop:3500 length:648 start_codon:yes stop_codon:yes gene_type:complete
MSDPQKNKARALRAYYTATTEARSDKITKILEGIERLKLPFPNRTKLSEYVAERLGEEEGSPVSSSTIRRNEKYNDLLIKYLLSVCPGAIPNRVDNAIGSSLAQRRLRKENEDKSRKIEELKERVAELEALLGKRLELEYAEKYASQVTRVEKIEKANNETDESLFEELYSAFMKLDGVVEIKPKEGVVYDWEEDRPIMTNTSFPKFFKWLGTKV